jgi:prepilin-type N-terminal cleavage/methylation domain-containing protein
MKKTHAFTLIELLTVIAIIGILAGILIPTVGAVKISANKARTKAQFSQWATSMGLFKQEYGYYPSVDNSNKIDPGLFIGALSASDYQGTKLTAGSGDLAGNKKRISFYSFSDSDILKDDDGDAHEHIIDAFRNSDIVVCVDANGDGIVKGSELVRTAVTPGNPIEGTGTAITPGTSDVDTGTGVRAGVVFYSAGRGDAIKDIVYSWK